MMMRKLCQLLFICACVAACSAAQAAQVRYMLWDSLQLPAYRQCAADFAKKNPGITVRITQSGWDDYRLHCRICARCFY